MPAPIPTRSSYQALVTVGLCLVLCFVAPRTQAAEPMALGIATQPSAALLQIAVEAGLLEAEGVDVKVTRYPSGKRAMLDGLFAGKAQVISSADAPVVANAFKRDDFAIIATIFLADNVNSIIARRDAGIQQPSDLNGKRLATQRASAVHYFLHLFMLKNQIVHQGTQKTFLPAVELPDALASGQIDAFSMREPFIGQAKALLGDNAIVFKEPGLYPQYELVVVDRDYLAANPEAVRGLLRALIKAHELLDEDPTAAATVVARFLDVDPEPILAQVSDWSTDVVLNQALLLALEFEAQWMIDDGITDQRRIPNMLRVIDPAPLKAVAPRAVTLKY